MEGKTRQHCDISGSVLIERREYQYVRYENVIRKSNVPHKWLLSSTEINFRDLNWVGQINVIDLMSEKKLEWDEN